MVYRPFARDITSIDRFVSAFLRATTDSMSVLVEVGNVFDSSLWSFLFSGAAGFGEASRKQSIHVTEPKEGAHFRLGCKVL